MTTRTQIKTPGRMVRVPRLFYDDHRGRDLPTPEAGTCTKRHVWIASNDPAMDEYQSDADYYATCGGFDGCRGVETSARATVKALKKAGVWTHKALS